MIIFIIDKSGYIITNNHVVEDADKIKVKLKDEREFDAKGIGFAIPIDMATRIVAQLKDNGEVTRGWLGVNIQDLKGDLAEYYGAKSSEGVLVTDLAPEMAQRLKTGRENGVVVVGVRPESKAYKAGVEQGDLILEVNRQAVSSTGELKQLLAKHKGGEGISLLVQRPNAGMLVLKMA